MPWEKVTVEMSREEFCKAVLAREKSTSALCREYGISRPTGYKWLKRYMRGESLSDRSCEPIHKPEKTSEETEQKILEIRDNHPAWGPRKIHRVLEREEYGDIPCKSTIGNILSRNKRISEEASRAATPYKRFQKDSSNEMWQTDFKGDFEMQDGRRCHPLTVIDDYSRYSLCVDAKGNERREGVIESFERLFEEYGLPESILCDNGNPWGASQSTGYTLFEVWLMDLDILTIHGRIRHPQTQGKDERFHKTMDDELLKLVTIKDMEEAQSRFDEFRRSYNHDRPHEALNMRVPAEYYEPAKRRKPEKIMDWDYTSEYVTRYVKSSGYITYGGSGYFLSEAFRGKVLGIRDSALEGCVSVYYRNFRIARIDLRERAVISRKMYRGEFEPAPSNE